MGLCSGFDVYPPFERTANNQAQYELFIHHVLDEYRFFDTEDESEPQKKEEDNVLVVDLESETCYIKFLVGEIHPYLPRRVDHFIRFSSRYDGKIEARPHISRVYRIAREHFRDQVYPWNVSSDFGPYICRHGCYSWTEVYAAEKRFEQSLNEEEEEEEEEDWKEDSQNTTLVRFVDVDEKGKGKAGPAEDDQMYQIKTLQGKGKAFIATRNISKGTRIFTETPLFKLPDCVWEGGFAEDATLLELKGLSRAQQRAFFELHNVHARQHSPVLGIVQSNLLPLTGEDDGSSGLFLEASRINHSCRPNAQHSWNADLECLVVHAMEDIKAGCEITISYVSGKSLSYAERQAQLKQRFDFSCACKLCSLTVPARFRSNDRLALIRSIESNKELTKAEHIRQRASEAFGQAHQLVELLEEEGVNDTRLPNAYYIAFQITAIVGDKARAKIFAERAYALRTLLTGDDNPLTIKFKQYAGKPVEFPFYGEGIECHVDNWEPPKGLGEDELEKWIWNRAEW
ncbi:hypothetical protein BGZ63DRAFT_401314 [Mariannaea sp. PMI_226]|nr:hypothetical protein BGZ63DRAFT_401314 [Mariannaea sp. PMI_226]